MQVIRFDTPQRAQNSGYDSEKHKYTRHSPLGHLTALTGVVRAQCDDWVTQFRACAGGTFKSNRRHVS